MLHLIKRFFGHLTAKALTDNEQACVQSVLPSELLVVFDAMTTADQRHSLDVWDRVDRRADLAQAALLHDIGKTNGPSSAVARSLATVAIRVRVPLTTGWKRYRDHGSIGADTLRRLHADPLAVAFAEFHPDAAPDGVSETDWQVLLDADNI